MTCCRRSAPCPRPAWAVTLVHPRRGRASGRIAPEDRDRATAALVADDRERGHLDRAVLARGRADPQLAMCRAPLVQRDRQRQFLEREVVAVAGHRLEARSPFLGRHLARLLEAHAEELPRRLVVEDERPVEADQERGRGEVRHKAARKDDLDRVLGRGDVPNLTEGRTPASACSCTLRGRARRAARRAPCTHEHALTWCLVCPCPPTGQTPFACASV